MEEKEDDGELFEKKMTRLTGELSEIFNSPMSWKMKFGRDWGRSDLKSDNSEIVIYQTKDGKTKIEVRVEDENVWLTQAQMVNLFNSRNTRGQDSWGRYVLS